MGLINAKNLKKAQSLLEKNRDKVGDVVGKATTQIDKATKGKSANLTAKVEQAARKYSGETVATTESATEAATTRPDTKADPADTTTEQPTPG